MTTKDAFDQTIEYFDGFWKNLDDDALRPFIPELQKTVKKILKAKDNGNFRRWYSTFTSLPDVSPTHIELNANAITVKSAEPLNTEELRSQLLALYPWRKGPFNLFDVHIDAEWQSWMKWDRLAPYLPSLRKKRVLDIGCGNGYYMFRMAQEDPKLLLGIDPSYLFLMQFMTVDKYVQSGARVLPIGIDALPESIPVFDLVFSMGVFYHRKDPIGHLARLRKFLAPEGELIFETLVVEGDEHTCLIPKTRYAQMRNVWFLPSVKMLEIMLRRVGFKEIERIDTSFTHTDEQRVTDWTFERSLKDYLDQDLSKTVEGYPPPLRAIFRAR